jgi:hypothetical protein
MWNGEMLETGVGLLHRNNHEITARIPHQSPPKGGDSFSPGEAMLRRFAALSPRQGRHVYGRKQQFTSVFPAMR